MSRIYEALQRAERERQTGRAQGESTVADPLESISEIESGMDSAFDLTLVPQHTWTPSEPHFPTLHGDGPGIERFRRLRSRLYQARLEAPLKTVLISSGMPSEGKSFAAANLAVSLAHNTVNNVLIIDGDLRRPVLHALFGTPNEIGLSDYLIGKAGLSDVMQRDLTGKCCGTDSAPNGSNLFIIPAGTCDEKSFEAISTPRFAEMIASIAPYFEWILVDSPPALAVSDAVDLARSADGVLLIAREAKTICTDAQRTQAAFSSARVLGFVLNDVSSNRRGNSYYGSYYYGNYGKKERAQASRS